MPVASTTHLLHLEDNPADHELVRRALARAEIDCRLTLVETLAEFQAAVQTGGADAAVDAVLADYHLAGFCGMQAWDWLRAQQRDLPFLIVSGAIGEATVAEALLQGVSDYVDKNRLARLPAALQRALELHASRRAQAQAQAELDASRQRLAELTEHLQASIERERAAIAREIHDDIGGALAALKFDLGWLARHVPTPEAQGHVAAALSMAEHALDASQRLMRNLRPAVLDQGLWPALQWLTRSFAERSGLALQLHGGLRAEVDAQRALVLYRCAQEALTNVLRHAQASAVRLELSDLDGILTLEVSDNGRGASAQDLAKLQSFGLLGLRERARSVDGWLDVASAPGQGLTLVLALPRPGAALRASAASSDPDWEHPP